MRVVIGTLSLSNPGGTESYCLTVARELDRLGHEVTLFNRGITNTSRFPGLRKIRGDHMHDASALTGEPFDVVIDVAGMGPGDVAPVVNAVVASAGRYVFVSTVSVYADHSVPQVEGQPTISTREGQDGGEAYGASKAAAEHVVMEAFGERALVVRPGLIVGPHDPRTASPTGRGG